MSCLKKAFAISLCWGVLAYPCLADDQLHLWIKAFIPNSHPSRPGYVRNLPNDKNRWVIPGPTIPWTNTGIPILFDTCFETDNRTFSSDSTAEARVTSEAVIVASLTKANIRPFSSRRYHRAGSSRQVDCKTGSKIAEDHGDVSGSHFGPPTIADGVVQLTVNSAVKNPLTTRFGTPSIDYGGTFTWDIKNQKLRFKGYTGVFPAFEAYAQLNNGPPKRIFGHMPEDGTSTWYLYDFSLMANTKSFVSEIDLHPNSTQTANMSPFMPAEELERDLFITSSRFQSQNGGQPLFAAALAVSAADAGRSETEIDALTSKATQLFQKHEQELEESGLASAMSAISKIRSDAGAILRSGLADGLTLRAELTALVDQTTASQSSSEQDWALPGEKKSAAQVVDEFERRTFRGAFDAYLRGQPNFKEVFDKHILPSVQIRPGSGIDAILKPGRTFSDQPLVRSFANLVKENQDSDGGVVLTEAITEKVKASIPQSLKSLTPVIQAASKRVQDGSWSSKDISDIALEEMEKSDSPELRAVVTAARLKDDLSIGNASAALQLAESLIAPGNPKLAKDINRVGNAAIQIAQVYGAYSKGGINGVVGAAGAAGLTGNSVGVALAVAGMLGGDGPGGSSGPDPAIMAALAQIQEQLETIRGEMNTRFDRIDSKLDTLYAETMEQFGLVRSALEDLQGDVTGIQNHLAQISTQISHSEMRIVDAMDRMRSDLVNLQMEPCLAWRQTTVIYDMPFDEFVRCLARFNYLATRKSSQTVIPPTSLTLSDLRASLLPDRPATEALPFLAAVAAGAGKPLVDNARLSEVMPPEEWIVAASSYLKVAQTWQKHYDGTPLAQLRGIIARGKLISEILNSASNPNRGGAIVSALLTAYSEQVPTFKKQLWETTLSIDTTQPLAGENLSHEVLPCRNGGPIESGDDWRRAQVTTSNNMNPVPLIGRRAARTNMGPIRWCVAEDNLWEFNAAQTKPLEVFLLAFERSPTGEERLVHSRVLRTTSSYTHPWVEFVGGVAGASHHGDGVGTIQSAWPELRQQLEATETSTPVDLARQVRDYFEVFTNIRSLEEKQVEEKLTENSIISKELYRAVKVEADGSTINNLEITSQLATRMATLALPGDQSSNDFLAAMLTGDAPLVSLSSLSSLEDASIPALGLPKIAASRAKAIDRLIGLSLGAADQVAPAYPEMTRTLSQLQVFFDRQLQRCAQGLRPAEACQ
ncbi:hypothetical protein HFN65_31510 [Rhizobium laguerreae]|uniref:hypothetical protein n=1 Tax=Rhizobium laguerreae TaxID=1076926 RepID=UPI001C923844|nr:hypothetical protein [Rhizobium laguerreae]MBY3575468.1 hypothetical protein [Rhizobium laguerreae]